MKLPALLSATLLAGCATAPLDAATVHERILTLDTHVDIPLDYMPADGGEGVDPGTVTDAQVDLPKMAAGGLDSAFFIIYTPQTSVTPANIAEARSIAETRYRAIDRLVRTYPDRVALAKTADEVESIVASGRIAALIGMENAYPLGNSVDDIPMWAERGVRYVGLTHFGANPFGDSSGTKPYETDAALSTHGGLSPLGRDLVRALNDHGILVDISHAGDETARQAMELSRVPVIASHSGVDGVYSHPRNLSDDLLDKLRDTGGVVQLVALAGYVKGFTDEQMAALEVLEQREAAAGRDPSEPHDEFDREMERIEAMAPRATVADYVDHIDYAVNRIGIDHVGIASDFDGGGGITGWQDASQTRAVTAALLARGYSERDIAKIWSGNVLRIMRQAEWGARK